MQRFKGVGTYGSVGLDFVLAVVIGFLGGRWLDGKFGTEPWLTIIGFGFGVAASFNILFKAAKRLREETERDDQRQREERGRTSGDDGDDQSGTRPRSGEGGSGG